MKTPTVKINTRVYTSNMRIYGTVHVLQQGDISGLLNGNRLFFPMTECKVYKFGLKHPPKSEDLQFRPEFLAVPKERVWWLTTGDTNKHLNARTEMRKLFLLYPGYVLKGDVLIFPRIRTSDFLVRAVVERPFQYLYNAEVLIPRQGHGMTEAHILEQFPVVTVNLANVAGVFDIKDDVDPSLAEF